MGQMNQNMPDDTREFLELHRSSLLADADPLELQNLMDSVSKHPDDLMTALLGGHRYEGMPPEIVSDVMSSIVDEEVAAYGSPYAYQAFARETSNRNTEFMSAVAKANGVTLDDVDNARMAAASGRPVDYDYMLAEYYSR